MRYARAPRIGLDVVDGRATLVDPRGVEIVELTPIGRRVWESLDQTSEPPTREQRGPMATPARADAREDDDVEHGTERVLAALAAKGLVVARSSPSSGADDEFSPDEIARLLRRATREPGPLGITVLGGSMRPLIERADRVLVAPADRARWGEVWAYCHQTGAVLVHRCRGRRKSGYLFQGDAERRADALVPPPRLIGRVVAVERDGVATQLAGRDGWGRGLPTQLAHTARRGTRLVIRRVRRRR